MPRFEDEIAAWRTVASAAGIALPSRGDTHGQTYLLQLLEALVTGSGGTLPSTALAWNDRYVALLEALGSSGGPLSYNDRVLAAIANASIGGGGNALDPDWTELVDVGFGSLNDPNSRIDSGGIAYSAGLGWSVHYLGGSTGLHRYLSTGAPYRLAPFAASAPADFSWNTHSVELYIRPPDDGVARVSPYLTGLAFGVCAVGLNGMAGVFVGSIDADTTQSGIQTFNGVGTVDSADPVSSCAAHFRKVETGFWSTAHFTDPGGDVNGIVNISDSVLRNTALADLRWIVQGRVFTASALTGHTQAARCYWRIYRQDSIGLTLGQFPSY